MAQLMPLPVTVSCFSKIQIGFTFLVPLTQVVPNKGLLNGSLCVCEWKSTKSTRRWIITTKQVRHRPSSCWFLQCYKPPVKSGAAHDELTKKGFCVFSVQFDFVNVFFLFDCSMRGYIAAVNCRYILHPTCFDSIRLYHWKECSQLLHPRELYLF